MRSPLVSIVIPTHNRAAAVCEAVASALAQTYPAVEVIVVDDGSTDDTLPRLERRFARDDRVHVVSRPNGGVAAARNTGLAASRGDYLAFLDSDDTWSEWKLEVQIACMERDPGLGMTWTDLAAVDAAGSLVAERYLRCMYRNLRGRRLGDVFTGRTLLGTAAPASRPDLARVPVYSGDVFTTMLLGSIVHTSTVVIRSSVREEVGWFDEALRPNGEDFDFHLRTSAVTDVGFIDTPTIRYRVGAADQLSGDAHMVALARNGLGTVRQRLTAAAHDPRISRRIRRRALAEAHLWLGRELGEEGHTVDAARHLGRSWLTRPTVRSARAMVRLVVPRDDTPRRATAPAVTGQDATR